jgi:hypothetical protein
MKKQILILAGTFLAVAFISCSKEGIETKKSMEQTNEEIATVNSSSARTITDPLTVHLEGWFPFNKNLKDAAGKLPDAKQWPASRGGVSYTADRHGIANAALKLDGNYYVSMANVPQQAHTSLSVWVKRSATYASADFLRPNGRGPAVTQLNSAFQGLVFTSLYTPYVNSAPYIDQSWHHVVVTFDSTYLKLYVDGGLANTSNYPQPFGDDLVYYLIGYLTEGGYWKGAVDDLRFYSRTLSANDVNLLHNQ